MQQLPSRETTLDNSMDCRPEASLLTNLESGPDCSLDFRLGSSVDDSLSPTLAQRLTYSPGTTMNRTTDFASVA
jgi:hypothetical protein